MDRTLRAVTGVLGADYESRAVGGGGTNGKWVFTSLDQLDGLIKKWKDIRDAIRDRRFRIERARELVEPPAADIMSVIQAKALEHSLEAMGQHAGSMYMYADAYIQKLEHARTQYVGVEDQNTTRMKSTHGG